MGNHQYLYRKYTSYIHKMRYIKLLARFQWCRNFSLQKEEIKISYGAETFENIETTHLPLVFCWYAFVCCKQDNLLNCSQVTCYWYINSNIIRSKIFGKFHLYLKAYMLSYQSDQHLRLDFTLFRCVACSTDLSWDFILFEVCWAAMY